MNPRLWPCVLGVCLWLGAHGFALANTDLGCALQLSPSHLGWTGADATDPIDILYARDAAANFDNLRGNPLWEASRKDTVDDLMTAYERTHTYADGSRRLYRSEVTARPQGPWSVQSGRDRWIYDVRLYVNDIWTKTCRPDGSCTDWRRDEQMWAECVSGGEVPYLLELDPATVRITPTLESVSLRFRLTHGGRPVRKSTLIQETLKRYSPYGALDCVPRRCSWELYPDLDEQGRFELQFKPTVFKPATIPMEFTCTGCGNTVQTTLVMQPEIVVAFFNGVANTRSAAGDSSRRLELEYGETYQDVTLAHEAYYNQTACGAGLVGKPSCLEDVAEVFQQRSQELNGVLANRWEVFWELLVGRQQQSDSVAGTLRSLLGDPAKALAQLIDSIFSAMLNRLSQAVLDLLTLFTDAPTGLDQANHLARLTRHASEGRGFLLVAHSQGNLFVNTARDGLLAAHPDAPTRVVHVAPASPTLRGQYVLADIDLVINALRVTGLGSVPGINVNLPFSTSDVTGHGFEPTYLDTARAAYAMTRGYIDAALTELTKTKDTP